MENKHTYTCCNCQTINTIKNPFNSMINSGVEKILLFSCKKCKEKNNISIKNGNIIDITPYKETKLC